MRQFISAKRGLEVSFSQVLLRYFQRQRRNRTVIVGCHATTKQNSNKVNRWHTYSEISISSSFPLTGFHRTTWNVFTASWTNMKIVSISAILWPEAYSNSIKSGKNGEKVAIPLTFYRWNVGVVLVSFWEKTHTLPIPDHCEFVPNFLHCSFANRLRNAKVANFQRGLYTFIIFDGYKVEWLRKNFYIRP